MRITLFSISLWCLLVLVLWILGARGIKIIRVHHLFKCTNTDGCIIQIIASTIFGKSKICTIVGIRYFGAAGKSIATNNILWLHKKLLLMQILLESHTMFILMYFSTYFVSKNTIAILVKQIRIEYSFPNAHSAFVLDVMVG